MRVWLIKPSADVRDGADILRSRIGLEAECEVISPEVDIYARFLGSRLRRCDVIIADEAQFFTPEQIDILTDGESPKYKIKFKILEIFGENF